MRPSKPPAVPGGPSAPPLGSPPPPQLCSAELELLNVLKAELQRIAGERHLPSGFILSEMALMGIARERPSTNEALYALPGVNQSFMDNHAARFLNVLWGICAARGLELDAPRRARG